MTLEGLAAVDFFATTLPRLRELPLLNVTVINELSFREAEQAPVISLSHSEGDDRDWFNLGITVTIDDEEVPFDELFKALAAAEEFMILPSGTYFALDGRAVREAPATDRRGQGARGRARQDPEAQPLSGVTVE